jgi:hypothetical protein
MCLNDVQSHDSQNEVLFGRYVENFKICRIKNKLYDKIRYN